MRDCFLIAWCGAHPKVERQGERGELLGRQREMGLRDCELWAGLIDEIPTGEALGI